MATKVLLIEDVTDLGRKGEIKTVKPGFARNFLLPKKRAVIADSNAIRIQERLKEERLKKAAEDLKDSEALATKINGKTLEASVKVDHDGHMYGSVSSLDIVHLCKDQLGIVLDRHFVDLKHPIKATGIHEIPFRFLEGVTASVTLTVKPEGKEL